MILPKEAFVQQYVLNGIKAGGSPDNYTYYIECALAAWERLLKEFCPVEGTK